jgi:hypothetical protein
MEGELLGVLGFGALDAAWVLLPLWGSGGEGERRYKLATGAGIFLVCYLIAFTILGYIK